MVHERLPRGRDRLPFEPRLPLAHHGAPAVPDCPFQPRLLGGGSLRLHRRLSRGLPVGPPEIVATLSHALGLKPETVMQDTLPGRPMTLGDGQPIRQLL